MLIHKVIHDGGLSRPLTARPFRSRAGLGGTDGSLWKIPRVWFYGRSAVHLRVLADALEELHLDRRLSVPWRVVLTFSDGDNAGHHLLPGAGRPGAK